MTKLTADAMSKLRGKSREDYDSWTCTLEYIEALESHIAAVEAERDAALADVKSTKTILDAKAWYIENSRYREDGTRCECCTKEVEL